MRGNYFYDQNTAGIPGVGEGWDRFGSDVSLRDHNRDGRLDLTVSAPNENNSEPSPRCADQAADSPLTEHAPSD
jgi:hypothetical protein